MEMSDTEIPPERRARLIIKGQLLYGRFCGTNGRGICAENFALHHIRLGESLVAHDLIATLEEHARALRFSDPHGRLAMTEDLAHRIRRHLDRESS